MNRRRLLASLGLAGSGGLLPSLFRSWTPTVHAQPGKKRFVIFNSPDGVIDNRRAGLVRNSNTDFTFNTELSPLNRVRDKAIYIENLFCPFNPDLHGSHSSTLTMLPPNASNLEETNISSSLGPSIDHVLARTLSAGDAFPVLGVGFRENTQGAGTDFADFAHGQSQVDANMPLSLATGPVDFFERYFQRASGASPETVKALQSEQRLLSSIKEDLGAFRRSLAIQERAQLESFESSVSELERSIQAQAEAGARCGMFGRPTIDGNDPRDLSPASMDATLDCVAQALSCGLSHVAYVSMTAWWAPHQTYPWLNPEYFRGELGHHHSTPDHSGDDALANQANQDITRWHYEQAVRFYEKLASYPDGDGTLQDSTVVMWFNHGGMAHHTGGRNHTAVILGDAGGKLKTNQFLQFQREDRSMSDLFVTLAKALDVPMTRFGAEPYNKGLITDLLR